VNPWVLAGTTFAACGVEAVEAATIVLAVSLTHGLRPALTGTLAALASLSIIIAIGAPLLARASSLAWIDLVAGLFLVYFGFTWLRKAVLRYAGRKARHDEAAIYASEVARLRDRKNPRGAFGVAFGGVFVEGLEVVIIVVTFAASQPAGLDWTIAGAVSAMLCVSLAAIVVRAPLARVPENTLKAVVGLMLLSLGTFWTGEGLHVAWRLGEATLLAIVCLYALVTVVAVLVLRSSNQPKIS
jgi:Ca2+/H+ antiporter, TMEM165/GDT1 family